MQSKFSNSLIKVLKNDSSPCFSDNVFIDSIAAGNRNRQGTKSQELVFR